MWLPKYFSMFTTAYLAYVDGSSSYGIIGIAVDLCSGPMHANVSVVHGSTYVHIPYEVTK
jgi:hypothetical protein